MAADRRAAGGADHPHRHLRQFLAHGRHRTVRPVFGDLLRPRPGDSRRAAGQPRRGRRSVHRDLEPRLHAVRGGAARHPRAAAAPLDRHRHGLRAHRRRAAGQAQQLRHRSVSRPDPGQRGGHGAGAGRAVPGQPSRGGRPSALLGLPDGRRGAAVQRGPRLRAAADHASGDAPRAHDGRPRAGDVAAGARPDPPDGRGLPRTRPRRGADRRDAAAGGNALQGDAGPRPRAARRGDRKARRGREAGRRRGVQALRHLRLPARSDAGCAARAGPGRGRGRVRGGDGRAAPPRPRRVVRLRRCRHRPGVVRGQGARRRHRVSRRRAW